MRFRLLPLVPVILLIAMTMGPTGRPAQALPPAGTDILPVVALVDVTSRLGTDNVALTGWVRVQRQNPRIEGGVEVVDTEIVAMSLQGASSIGAISVAERPNQGASYVSSGQIRSLQPSPQQFPARSFFDVFADVTVPASPSGPAVVHNEQPMRVLLRKAGQEAATGAWPPNGATYELTPIFGVDNDGDTRIDEDTADDDGDGLIDEDRPGTDPDTPGTGAECTPDADCDGRDGEDPPLAFCPAAIAGTRTLCDSDSDGQRDEDPACIPLMNAGNVNNMKAGFCVRNLTMEVAPEWPSYSVARGGPSGRHPADILALTPVTAVSPPGPVQVSGNDNFASGWAISSLPFTGQQSTVGTTTEPGEPTSLPSCPFSTVPVGATVWYRFTPSVSGTVTVDTFGSSFDTVLAAYTGTALNTLTQVACNDDFSGLLSQISFPVTAGTTYHLQVGGYNYPPPSTGSLTLHVSLGGGGPAGPTQAPFVRIPCASLGLTADGCDTVGAVDDLDALSYGNDLPASQEPELNFSVGPGAQGLAGTAVAVQRNCPSPEPEPDEFGSLFNNTNYHVMDGNGPVGACSPAFPLGLIEGATVRDDLDALDESDASKVDPDGNGVPNSAVYFSLDPASPSLGTLGTTAAAVLRTVNGGTPTVFASPAALGLEPGDDLDGLCLKESGNGVFGAGDTLYFSLASGSPTLGQIGAGPGDVLAPGSPDAVNVLSEATLGLAASDDLDAMKCKGLLNTADVSALALAAPAARLAVGQTATLKVVERIANAGPSNALIGVQLDASEPAALAVRWLAGPGDTCANNGVSVSCSNAAIDRLNFTAPEEVARKQTVVRNLQVTCGSAGSHTLTLTGALSALASGGDPNPGDNSASASIAVECLASPGAEANLRIDQFLPPRFVPLASGATAFVLVDAVGANAGPSGAYPGSISASVVLRAYDPDGVQVRWAATGSDVCRNNGASVPCGAAEIDELAFATPVAAGLQFLAERVLIVTCETNGLYRVPLTASTTPASLSDLSLADNLEVRTLLVLCLPLPSPDSDGDGLLNRVEAVEALDAANPDSDADGLQDGLDPDGAALDYDGDGCRDGREWGSDVVQGGRRNPQNFFDFFDTPLPAGPPGTGSRDRSIAVTDIFGVAAKFGTFQGGPPLGSGQVYNPDFDRTSRGPAPNLGPGNGAIAVDDIFSVVAQFGNTCVD